MPTTPSPQKIAPLYLLSSNEPLLIRDWLDAMRIALRKSGYDDIQTQVVDSAFDWSGLIAQGENLSLFSSEKCRIINLPSGKPGQKGSMVIQRICDQPPEQTTIIWVLPWLDATSKKSAWYQRLQQAAEVIEFKPVSPRELPEWISQRAKKKGFELDPQTTRFLAERTEGNLLATDQELEKLSIRFPKQQTIAFELIQQSVSQSARYNHFILVESCLAGQTDRALKVLNSLRTEGYATSKILWPLQSSLSQLNKLKLAQKNGLLNARLWQTLRIWQGKQRLYETALTRFSHTQIEHLLQACASLDRTAKGQLEYTYPDQDWLQLKSIIGQFCSLPLPAEWLVSTRYE